jgi:diguanylate cyclase (GGDEF)-like protein
MQKVANITSCLELSTTTDPMLMAGDAWPILDLLPEPILLVTLSGTIVWANRSAKKMLPRVTAIDQASPPELRLSEFVSTDEDLLRKWLYIWARSSSMTPGRLMVLQDWNEPVCMELEAAALYQPERSPLIVLRFQKQASIVHKLIDLKVQVDSLDRKLAQQLYENHKLQTLAHQDGLTLVANRRTFEEQMQSYWLAAERDRVNLSIILLDIDHFKLYNDTYGHLQGDVCLRQVAQAIQQQARQESDLVARYGGEEFVVVLKAPLTVTLAIAGRIMTGVRELALPHQASAKSFVTLSAGIGYMVPSADRAWPELLAIADRALYQAKQAGRDCFLVGHG